MKVFKTFLVYFLRLLQMFFKQKKRLIIHSFPDFDGMTRSIIKENKKLEIVILTSGSVTAPKWTNDNNLIIANKFSIRGVYLYLGSKYILFTHGLYGSLNQHKKKIVINLWHGMPLKNIGYLDELDSGCTQHCHYTLNTGPVFREVMAKAFKLDKNKVMEIGLPRNDLLECQEESEEKYIMMLPTYRVSKDRTDSSSLKDVFGIQEMDLEALNQVLIKHNVNLYIKPHPMEKQGINFSLNDFSNIKVITDKFLKQKNVTLYEMLAYSTMLITDLSSVIFDYWLTEKPIIIFFPDYKEYTSNRGFAIEFNYEKIFNQFYNQSSKELVNTVDKVLSKQLEWPYHWDSLGFHSHRYQSTKRLFALIEKLEA